jgi:hypothetical protein
LKESCWLTVTSSGCSESPLKKLSHHIFKSYIHC